MKCRKRTKTIVEVPVIAKTVHIRVTSPYHFNVPLGGISFGPKNFCKNVIWLLGGVSWEKFRFHIMVFFILLFQFRTMEFEREVTLRLLPSNKLLAVVDNMIHIHYTKKGTKRWLYYPCHPFDRLWCSRDNHWRNFLFTDVLLPYTHIRTYVCMYVFFWKKRKDTCLLQSITKS